ncbi:DNA polymerase III subunit delta' [Williamsoniiplasma lucivorax]|uniref:DNA polymerase III subunit delta n=1 Tax=Williamsoniiplasma lucivorax TaxID=209274 RepID=A0A2S5RF96_9MOLU|nr:DNA polymerase III subunit delta' [Williamsoniiplasma lucivorax]PPE05882.1 DNA polymerase III subunit delta' [Williamsoniiplasma lucivorax]
MLKNNLINELKQLYKNNNLYSSIILNSKNIQDAQEISEELIRYMFCENGSDLDDRCVSCERAKKKLLFDVIHLGDGTSEISKEEVKQIMDKFSLTSIEKTAIKVYVINVVENLKIGASNALLKFLEEPPLNTYALLLSKDRTNIIPTIKSRCKLFVIETNADDRELNALEKLLITNSKEEYLLSANNFKKIDKASFIEILEQAFNRTIIKKFPQFAEDTIILIEDLKKLPNDKLAIDNYFIKIAERL